MMPPMLRQKLEVLFAQPALTAPDVAFTQAGTACALQFVELPYGGQFGPMPLQNSAGMDPLAGWHTVVFGWKESSGHSGLWPEQTSCTSQLPAKPLHIVAPCFREYLQITPVEFTRRQNADVLFAQVASGTPDAALTHPGTACAGQLVLKPYAGQVVLLPVQFCAGIGGLTLAALHTKLLGSSTSAGHSVDVPLHSSGASHAPAAALQISLLSR